MTENPTYKTTVYNLQRYLRQLSYTDKRISAPPVDGIFGEQTKKSLTEFQRAHALLPSGIADKVTWDALYSEYLLSRALYEPPRALDIFPRTPDGYSVSIGDEFFLVSVIQFLLNELRTAYDSFIPLLVSGVYNEATAENIRDFQRRNQLSDSGRVDKATWDALARAYNEYAANYV